MTFVCIIEHHLGIFKITKLRQLRHFCYKMLRFIKQKYFSVLETPPLPSSRIFEKAYLYPLRRALSLKSIIQWGSSNLCSIQPKPSKKLHQNKVIFWSIWDSDNCLFQLSIFFPYMSGLSSCKKIYYLEIWFCISFQDVLVGWFSKCLDAKHDKIWKEEPIWSNHIVS